MRDTVTNGGNRIEINTIQAIKNSANKLLMKQCFHNSKVKTAKWFTLYKEEDNIFALIHNDQNIPFDQIIDEDIEFWDAINNYIGFPIISKHIKGSRGTGNKKHDTQEQLESWMESKNLNNYIFEKYYNYVREYRLHVDSEGCFYACRKMLKSNAPQEHRWYRNDDHCVWIMEDNELFDRPVNWDQLVEESVKALNSVGLDVGAIDLRIQSATNNEEQIRENPEFIIVEINSAPSFGEITSEKYIEQIPQILNRKYNEQRQ
jgi:glutathione synthase/RimK-type ligase-like ATP-grasp enzyme